MERKTIHKNWKGGLIQRAQNDPVWWIENVLGDTLWQKQKSVASALVRNERVACPASFGVGKCMEENERLVLSTGEVALAKDLVNKSFSVLAFDEATQQQVATEAFAFDNGLKPVYRVRTNAGREIVRTGNHPLYSCEVTQTDSILVDSIRWRSVEALAKTADAAVAIPVELEINNQDCDISYTEITAIVETIIKERRFPSFVWKLSNRQLGLLVTRLFACYDWVKDDGKTYIKDSKELIRDIELVMLRVGIFGCVSEVSETEAIWVIQEPEHWMCQELDSKYVWDKVVSIEYVGDAPTVGVSVPKYHTYLTTFVEHNTFLAARLALWFLYNFAPAKVISTAPTSRQVKDLLWSELRKAHAKARVALGGTPLQLSLTVAPNHYAVGFTPDDANYDAFTGYHSPNLLLLFDQAGGIPNVLWEAAEGLMTSQHCRWLSIGNTAISDGAFADICMPERKSTFGTWKVIPITAEESPNVVAKRDVYPGLISYDWVEKRKKQWGEDDPMYKIFVKAMFVPGVQMVVIPYEFLETSYNSYGEMDEEDEIEIGLDVARTGLDSTVWLARAGSRALEVKAVNGNDTMQVAGGTIEFIRHLEAKNNRKVRVTKIDTIGIGAGVYDRLLEQEVPVVAINNAAVDPVVDRERFSNVRAEMAWALRHRFEQRGIGLRGLQENQPEYFELLQRDIQVQKYEITSAGKILLWPKEKIKKELGRSPDYWDALVMAYEEPGGGPAQVNFLSSSDIQPTSISSIFSISDEEWKTLLGEQVDINHPSFVSLRM